MDTGSYNSWKPVVSWPHQPRVAGCDLTGPVGLEKALAETLPDVWMMREGH